MKPLRSRGRPLTLEELETVYRRDGAAFERVAIAIVRDEQLGCDAVHDAFVLATDPEDETAHSDPGRRERAATPTAGIAQRVRERLVGRLVSDLDDRGRRQHVHFV